MALPHQKWCLFDCKQEAVVIRLREGSRERQNAESVEGAEGDQSLTCPVHCGKYATSKMLIVFPREKWRQYLLEVVNYFFLPSLEEMKKLIDLQQNFGSAISGVLINQIRRTSGMVDYAVESILIPRNDDNWEL